MPQPLSLTISRVQFVPALNGRTIDVINPSTDKKLGVVSEAGAADIDVAVYVVRRGGQDARQRATADLSNRDNSEAADKA